MRTHCITIDLANQGRRQVRARFDGGRMSSNGGALLLQAVDQRIGLTRRLAVCGSATGAIRWPARAPSTGSSWADPAALAAGAGGGAGGRRVLPRRVDGVVRGGRGRRLRVRPGPERAAVPRFPLSDAGELEPQAAGGGQGGVAAGRGARGNQRFVVTSLARLRAETPG